MNKAASTAFTAAVIFASMACSMAAEPPDKAKKIARVQKLRAALGRDARQQTLAFAELQEIAWGDPKAPDAEFIEEIVKTYVLAINRLTGGVRTMAAERFCVECMKFKDLPGLDPAAKVKALLGQVETKDRANAEVKLVLPMFRFLLEVGDPDAQKIVSGFLKLLREWAPVFELMRQYPREDTIGTLAEVANDKKNNNLIMRRDAVKYLGAWGVGAPLYKVRVPALLAALDTPATSSDALTSLQSICFPDYTKAGEWKNWWKQNESRPDDEIIREDFKNAYERQRDKQKKSEAAIAVSEWIRDWGNPAFKWAVPVLIDPLLGWEDRSVRERVVSALGGIGAGEALKPMSGLLQNLKADKISERSMICELISGVSKIAPNASAEDKTAASKLLISYLDSIHEEVVAAAAEAMGTLGDQAAVPKLIEIMNTTTKPRAAMRAAESLGMLKASSAVEGMLAVLLKSVQEEKLGLESLARAIIRGLRYMDIRSEDVVRNVIIAIPSKHDSLSMEAISLVGAEWQSQAALQPIRMVFDDDKRNRSVREHALKAIAAYPFELSSEIVFSALRNPRVSLAGKTSKDPKAKEELSAARAFFAIASECLSMPGKVSASSRPELLALLKDQDHNPDGRIMAVRWLGRDDIWNEEECLPAMILCMRSDNTELVNTASDVLKAHPSTDAIEKLIAELPSTCPREKAEYWMTKVAAVLQQYIYLSNKYDYQDHTKNPDFGANGKDWLAWWKKTKSSFKFNDPEDEDEEEKK